MWHLLDTEDYNSAPLHLYHKVHPQNCGVYALSSRWYARQHKDRNIHGWPVAVREIKHHNIRQLWSAKKRKHASTKHSSIFLSLTTPGFPCNQRTQRITWTTAEKSARCRVPFSQVPSNMPIYYLATTACLAGHRLGKNSSVPDTLQNTT